MLWITKQHHESQAVKLHVEEEKIIHQNQMQNDNVQAQHKMAMDQVNQQQKLQLDHATAQIERMEKFIRDSFEVHPNLDLDVESLTRK